MSLFKRHKDKGLVAVDPDEGIVINFGFQRDMMLYEKQGRRFFIDKESGGGSELSFTIYIRTVRQEQLVGPTVDKVDEIFRKSIEADIRAAAETLQLRYELVP